MRVTLVHNARAGDRRVPDPAELVVALEGLGWRAKVVDRNELDEALRKPGEVVVVAGGDGTVGKVAKRLAGTGIPMAVIPTGTANNVARSLGIGVEVAPAIQSLRRAALRDVDLGVVGSGERFVEGFGVGLFACVMAERATRKHKKLERASELIADALQAYEPESALIEIDGRFVSGEHLLASVMNLRSMGPALGFAPDAEFDDGLLDVVIVRPEHREALLSHLKRGTGGDEKVALPRFEIHRAEYVRFRGKGGWAHIDDRARALCGDVEVRVEPRTLRVFVPQPAD
jgi:diacylglycerol kinase (ATP)